MGKCRACGSDSEMIFNNEKLDKAIHKELSSKEKFRKPRAKIVHDEPATLQEDSEDDVIWYSDTSDEAIEKRREMMIPATLKENML
jgi:hypothetical protein